MLAVNTELLSSLLPLNNINLDKIACILRDVDLKIYIEMTSY